MRRFLCSLTLAAALAAPTGAVDIDPAAPEAAVLLPAQVLKTLDFTGWFKRLPPAQQEEYANAWKKNSIKLGGAEGAKFDEAMGKLLAPDALDKFMAEAEPGMKKLTAESVAQAAMQMKMMAGMLPMMLMQQEPGAQPPTAEETQLIGNLSTLIGGISDWLPTAGIEDVEKLRAAATKVIAGAKAMEVKDAAGFKALTYEQLLQKVPTLVKAGKEAAALYDLQADKLLDSIQVAKVAGDGALRTLTLKFNAFGKDYTQDVKVEQKGDHWEFSPTSFPTFQKKIAEMQAMQAAHGAGGPPMGGGEDAPPAPPMQ